MSKHVVTFGEIMLRLKPAGFERFLQTPRLEATFGGGESNVALSLANFGLDVVFVSALPANPLADACIRFLQGYGINTSFIHRSGERLGIYFLEMGANQRPSIVVYDRAHSGLSTVQEGAFDWDVIFDDADEMKTVPLHHRIDGCEIETVRIPMALVEASCLIVLSHVKGHDLTGFGGALKNLGMGCVSRDTKRAEHMVNRVPASIS